jgi:hypothetical protein
MDIHLPDSFATPLQHFLTGLLIPTICSDAKVDELYYMLHERMTGEFYRDKNVTAQAIHNNCLSILNNLIRKGKLGGAALCEVEDIPNDRFLITVHWAAVRTWTTHIKTQQWDGTRDFIFTIREPL